MKDFIAGGIHGLLEAKARKPRVRKPDRPRASGGRPLAAVL
jgi:hypothetical protein